MLRIRMRKIIKLLETHSFNDVEEIINDPKNKKAVEALIDIGCVKATRTWGGKIVALKLLDHSATYELQRSEIWLNRFFGFMAGIITTAVGELIVYVIMH